MNYTDLRQYKSSIIQFKFTEIAINEITMMQYFQKDSFKSKTYLGKIQYIFNNIKYDMPT